jgi:hypothetical protein
MNAVTFTLCEGVVHVETEDGTSRLMDFGNRFYWLSAVATQMLRATLDRGADAAVEWLAQEYGERPERIRSDLEILLVDLERKRLIRRSHDRCIMALVRRAMISVCVVPIIWGVRLIPNMRAQAWLLLALAWLNCQLLGWAYTVRAWRIGYPLRTTLVADPETMMQAIDATVRSAAATHPLPVECKERALTTWALARIAGLPIELVVGFHPFPLEGHCWCVSNGVVYSDDSERCEQFEPVWRCS